ncbi:MAG: anaerobic ribonucleoside-triphosphate reductase activating protein [Chlorobi bacterium]|nr:anaerobic ribonucleoside-triphosphate reductase activating protein [Chlorobiota bacterium]
MQDSFNDIKYMELPIGGFQKQSLIDYPGHISAVVFTRGCNFRCAYCHNPELVLPELIVNTKRIDTGYALGWISNNRDLLDAVVITGGEPTLHSSLYGFISVVKEYGLSVKLDTNGSNPQVLSRLLGEKLVDYVAMDIKAPLVLLKYKKIVGGRFNSALLGKVEESIKIIINSGAEYEFRTTLDATLGINDIKGILPAISGKYYLQPLRSSGKIPSGRVSHLTKEALGGILLKQTGHVSISLRE